MSEEQKRILERQLWGVANTLRGKMNADEYKNYILGFIFYKYLSEKLEKYVNEKLLASEDLIFSQIKENSKELEHIKVACIGHLGFFLKPIELFSYLVKKGKGEIKNESTFIIEDLKNVLNDIERTSAGTASEDDFKGLFDDMDLASSKLGSRESDKNEVVVEVLSLLSSIDFKLEDTKSDVLGDAYEYLIGDFAAGAGKKGGEFYTPPQVSRLLAQIVSAGKGKVKSAYDPTCGSGSLLLRLSEFTDVVNYYGQELNPTTYNLARMNMILHGVHFEHFKILQGNTLTEDMHKDLKAEVIVANPPFSLDWKGDGDPSLVHDDRFSQYGRLAPKSAADYAFVTHMLHHLADNGTMAIVLPHGALFRSGAEGHIRKYIIEKQNYLDTVIGLPSNLFYGTSIPATILVFKKCRKDDEDILFIDASKDFEKGKNQNTLTNENIEKIFNVYTNRKEVEKYSHRASLDEIKENDYNLNISRYVDTFEEEKVVDIDEVSKKLFEIQTVEKEIYLKVLKYCHELNLPKPDGNNLPLLKEYRKGVMQKLLSQNIRFKLDNGSKFQKWEEKKMSEIGKTYNGLTGKTGGDFGSGSVFVTYKQIFDDSEIKLDKFAFVNVSPEENQNKVQFGDVLFTTSSETPHEVGFASVLLDKNVSPYLNSFSFGFRPNSLKELDPYFAKLFFRSPIFRRDVIKLAQGSTRYNISKIGFMKIKILMPSFLEQQKIADFLTSFDKVIESKERQISQAEQWKKGLMQGLFV